MRSVLILAVSSFVMILGSSALQAHHSAAQFDFSKPVTVEGTVKSFEVMNPHTHATITLSDAKGTRDTDFEGHSASNFYRAGYVKGAVQPGEHIQLIIAPRRNGSDGGFIVWFKTQHGLEVGFRGVSPTTNSSGR